MEEPNIKTIGEWLFATHEHDPVYTALHGSDLGHDTLHRFCLAHWCFYSLRTACWIAEGPDYWGRMREAAAGRAHRGSERRHFRGEKAVNAVAWFEKHHNRPEDTIPAMFDRPLTYTEFQRSLDWPEFGAYFKFKVADVMETVLGLPIDFTDSVRFFHDSPVKGAKLVAEDWFQRPMSTQEVVNELVTMFSAIKAPPRLHRPIGVQEVETLLCAYKTFKTSPKYVSNPSNYWNVQNHDIVRYREQLGVDELKDNRIAQKLLEAIPPVPGQVC